MSPPGSRLTLGSWLAALAPVLAALNTTDAAPEAPFNVLFILVDQHNAHALGCYGNGFGGLTTSLTPNLDRLADEGVRFENACCASPQCCPSRYSLLTGRWPHNHGLRRNEIWEPRTEPTLPSLAREAGYSTATFGKHHLFWLYQSRPLAEDHGFDLVVDERDYFAFCDANGPGPYHAAGNVWVMPGLPAGLNTTGFTSNSNDFHPAGYWANRVISFLDEHARPDPQPFVCWYSMFGPHTPILPTGPPGSPDWAHLHHPFENLDLPPNLDKVPTTARLAALQNIFASVTETQHREVLSYYYGLISQIDDNVGRVLDRLDELGLAERTLVVYTADHGEMAGEMGCWTKGAGSYDATNRVPLIVRLPGVLPQGKVVHEVVNAVDLFPTLAELTGVPVPREVRERMDGRSLVDLMLDRDPPPDWPGEAFSELGPGGPDARDHRMVRTRAAKFSFDERGGGQEEYYDLTTDPWELDDLLAGPGPEPAGATDLRARLSAWWNDGSGHAPIYRLTGGAASRPGRVHDPVPGDLETDVACDVDPSWLRCTGSLVQQVHLGTDPASLQLFATLAGPVSSFNPGSLAPATTYYWRVDGSNDNGCLTGPVWSFTTQPGPPCGPDLATGLIPPPGAAGIPRLTRLTWEAAPDATTQDVYFGRAGELHLLATGLSANQTTLDPGALAAGAHYQWRVDGGNANGITEGDVWNFHTDPVGLPARARAPRPAHMATPVDLQPMRLAWTAGAGALSHEVYFGTTFPLEPLGNRTSPGIRTGPLQPGQTYYWRVDEINDAGTTVGFTWRFTARSAQEAQLAPR